MEELAELYSLLASEDRLILLTEISRKPLKMTQLAPKISATAQETSRHLARLKDANLIDKDPDGNYRLTAFAKLVMHYLPAFTFLLKNKQYFLNHDITFLPEQFLTRLGDFLYSQYGDKVSNIFTHGRDVIFEAENYVWLMADQNILTTYQDYHKIVNKELSLRMMLPPNRMRYEDFEPIKTASDLKLEIREIKEQEQGNVPVSIAMNEKIAGVCFPDLKGQIDFNSGFRGTSNTEFHGWCRDLFEYYWSKSKPTSISYIRWKGGK